MDINVRVTVDLGERTMALVGGALAAQNAVKRASDTVSAVLEKYADKEPMQVVDLPEPEQAVEKAAPVPKKPRQTKPAKEPEAIPVEEPEKAATPEPAAPVKEPDAVEMSDEEKLEEIKAEVTKFVKKGNSADIKSLLTHFDATRASLLKPEQYEEFRKALARYGAGESVESIINELA